MMADLSAPGSDQEGPLSEDNGCSHVPSLFPLEN